MYWNRANRINLPILWRKQDLLWRKKKICSAFSTIWKLWNIFTNIYLLAITHVAPKLDNVDVIPLPIPVPPPVIKATFPWKVFGSNITLWRGEKNEACGALFSWCSTFGPRLKNWKKKRGKLVFPHFCIQDCHARLDFHMTVEVTTITALL